MGGSSKGKKGKVGGTTANCAQEGDLAVIANQVGAAPTPFKDGLDVNVTPAGGAGKTDAKGLKVYTKLITNTYKVTASLGGTLKDKFELLSKNPTSVNVPAGGIGVANFDVAPFAKVKAKVVLRRKAKDGKETDTVLDGVKLEMTGPATKQATTPKDPGWVTFEKLSGGAYTLKVASLGAHAAKCKVPAPVKISLTAGAAEETVVVVKALALLRVVVWDKADKPVSGVAWAITGPATLNGTTAANGMIEVKDLNLEPATGTLVVTPPVKPAPPPPPPPPPPPAPDPNAPPPYPPDVDEKDFKEPAAKPVTPDNDPGKVEWAVKLDELEAFDNEPGNQRRLHNLGFEAGASADAARITRSVKSYQKHYLKQDAGSGKLADIKTDLIKRHDKA